MKFPREKFIFSLLCSLALVSCSPSKKTAEKSPESQPEVKALNEVADSFRILPDSSLSIAKAALDKEFLLESTLSKQDTIADFTSLRSRVVAFARSENYLYLVEATAGHLIGDFMKPEFLLMRFPILSEDATTLRFRFSDGANRIFESYTYRTSAAYVREKEFRSSPGEMNKLREQKLEGRHLIIRLSHQFESGEKDNLSIDTLQTHFFLSPYRPKTDFPRMVNHDFRRFGFYETPPLREDTPDFSLSYALKFDHRQPIIFYISSNTPEEVRPAIRRGVEYWNRVDPRLRLVVKIAPEGVSAPQPGMNIIQWIEWDTSSSAHADFSYDPRTGELLSTSIFLTSSFREAAFRANQGAGRPQTPLGAKKSLQLGALQYERICSMNKFALIPAPIKPLSPEEFDRAADAYLLETVAHEVGHTIGLRHNFAASRASNIRRADREKMFRLALAQAPLPADVKTVSGVMDYVPMEDIVIMMAWSDQTGKALPHDELAARKLYFNEDNLHSRLPYCHDDQQGSYVDCLQWDSGALISESVASLLDLAMDVQRAGLIYAFVDFKGRPEMKNLDQLSEIDLSDSTATGAFETHSEFRGRLLRNFTKDVDSTAYRAARGLRLTTYEFESENASMLDFFARDIHAAGGFHVPFRVLDEKWVETAVRDFMLLLREDRGNLSIAGKKVSFSAEELGIVRTKARQFYSKVKDVLNEDLFESAQKLSSAEKPLLDHPINDELIAWLRTQVFEVLTSDLPAQFSPEWTEKVPVRVLVEKDEEQEKKKPTGNTYTHSTLDFHTGTRAYRLKTRLAALGALKSIHPETPYFYQDELEHFKTDMSCYYDQLFATHTFDQIDAARTSKRFQRWFLDENQVSKAILGN